MKATLSHPSWYDIEKGCAQIVHQMLKDRFDPTTIVGLIRGGLVPTAIIGYMLGLDKDHIILIPFSSAQGKGEQTNNGVVLPELPTKIIWILDDIIDSGYSMLEISNHYKQLGYIVKTGAVYYKESACIVPDYYWKKIPKDANFIEFPWE